MRRDICILAILWAAIGCVLGAAALANEKSSTVGLPEERVIDQAKKDERVKYSVEEHLRTDGRVDWEVLDVNVSQGRVTLYGEVETEDQKGLATLIASTVPGVEEITNRIIVDRALSKDHRLQKAVWSTLRGVDGLRQQTDTMRVRAKDGVVRLSGMVATEMQRAAAEKAAESVSGVEKVLNAIYVGSLPFQTMQDKLRKEGRERVY